MRLDVTDLPTRLPLVGLMPSIFQEDFITGRFCAGLDEVLAPVLATLDCLDAYVDPALAPEDFLEWLATWVGATIVEDWPVSRKRDVVASAAAVHMRRGTVSGLREELELYTGGQVEITDTGGVSVSSAPRGELPGQAPARLQVRITMDGASSLPSSAIDAIIAASKPAHVGHVLEIISTSGRDDGGGG
jgi:phage tail-like protein